MEFYVPLDGFPPLTEDQVERAMALFDAIDRDNSRTLETSELAASVRTASKETYAILGDLVSRSVIPRSMWAAWLADVKAANNDQVVEAVIAELGKCSRSPSTPLPP